MPCKEMLTSSVPNHRRKRGFSGTTPRKRDYGRFYRSKCVLVLRHVNDTLVRWAMRKYKRRFKRRERAATHWLGQIAHRSSRLLALWQLGIKPAAAGQ